MGVQMCNFLLTLWDCKIKSSCSCLLTLTWKITKLDCKFESKKPHFGGWPSYSKEGINSKEYRRAENPDMADFSMMGLLPIKPNRGELSHGPKEHSGH